MIARPPLASALITCECRLLAIDNVENVYCSLLLRFEAAVIVWSRTLSPLRLLLLVATAD
jgi:hypothetical protein